ncbi:MAG: hypothetical protein HQL97_07510 [Magnetococcales bacterium]|nr:hypothetical protein [Magnetococcales bacterium]
MPTTVGILEKGEQSAWIGQRIPRLDEQTPHQPAILTPGASKAAMGRIGMIDPLGFVTCLEPGGVLVLPVGKLKAFNVMREQARDSVAGVVVYCLS